MSLTPEQRFHNAKLDLDIFEAIAYNNKLRTEYDVQMEAYNKFHKENPDFPIKSFGLPLHPCVFEKTIYGYRYVE